MRLFVPGLRCLALLATQGLLLGQGPGAALVQVDYQKSYQTMDGLGASSNFYENLTANLPEPARSQMFDLDDNGQARYPEELLGNLLGLKLQLQYAVDDPLGGWLQSLAFSHGLEARLGY